MKTNAIIRIVLFSAAIILLLGILGAGLAFGLYTAGGNYTVTTTSENHAVSSVQNGGAAAEYDSQIRDIDIDWAAGSITILPDADTSVITVSEYCSENTKYQMKCSQSGNTLKIEYSEKEIRWTGISLGADYSKDLVITVPADWACNSLEIDAASANVEIQDLTIGEVDFDGASGTCNFVNCQVDQIDLDGASGDISFTGTLNELDFDGASASCRIHVTNVPNRITMDGMSGDLELTLPEDCGFTASLDALSSDFHSDFPTTVSNGNYVYGDGRCRISFSGMSGDLTILKGQ